MSSMVTLVMNARRDNKRWANYEKRAIMYDDSGRKNEKRSQNLHQYFVDTI